MSSYTQKFVKLMRVGVDHGPVYIAVAAIDYIQRVGGATLVGLNKGNTVEVAETPEEIFELSNVVDGNEASYSRERTGA